jgi:hypothetical protein
LVVFDEAYHHYAFRGSPHLRAIVDGKSRR